MMYGRMKILKRVEIEKFPDERQDSILDSKNIDRKRMKDRRYC